ncbi:hypothetical protein [Caballeronia zhejiangensis]|uniref:hypothetical protein n=1 Tax=Caballeronia zhejiangensis TaxID=871203 RepID=UPI00158BEB22|nr:hypothetical protein [Caballeronia zhejiangensis]MCG7403043.1 hypothetical protein [Caballeronia zhejiangensis]MCI1043867.1 hypothetical protein [Caballeronia zhejiangensis]
MSTFARIAANRLRDMQYPLTENERLQYATLLDALSTDVGRCHGCLQEMATIIGGEFIAGADLSIELPLRLYRIINGEKHD